MLPSKVYDVLKWLCLIAIPATAILWFTIGKVWNFPYLAEIETTITAVGAFIGALIGVSTVQYNKAITGEKK